MLLLLKAPKFLLIWEQFAWGLFATYRGVCCGTSCLCRHVMCMTSWKLPWQQSTCIWNAETLWGVLKLHIGNFSKQNRPPLSQEKKINKNKKKKKEKKREKLISRRQCANNAPKHKSTRHWEKFNIESVSVSKFSVAVSLPFVHRVPIPS